MLRVVTNESEKEEEIAPAPALDELAGEGTRRMLAAALEEEAASYVEARRHERDQAGRALQR